MPVTVSTRKAWFSAPRLNLSSMRRRSSGVATALDQDIDRQCAEDDPCQQRAEIVHDRDEHGREQQIDDQGQGRPGQETPDVFELARLGDAVADRARLEI